VTDRTPRRRVLVGLAAFVLLGSAACGSTVQGQARSAASTGEALAPDASGVPSALGNGPAAATDGAGAAQGTSAAAKRTAAAAAAAAAARRGGAESGINTTSIKLGVTYTENAAAANAALGGKGISTGNERRDTEIVVEEINRAGGVLGRKLVPVFRVRDGQSAESVSAQAQAECVFFTQDQKVFAVLQGNGQVDWETKTCLNDHGVPAITAHITSLDDDDRPNGLNVDVSGMSMARMTDAIVGALRDGNWMSPWNATTGQAGAAKATVGVMGYDLPAVHQAVDRILVPGLRSLGAAPAAADIVYVPLPPSQAEIGASAAAIQNATLRLRGDGVDHIVLMDQGGALTLIFANNAYSQRYFPRYAGSSSNGFQALLSGGSIQAEVLRGAVGAGWQPVIDLPAAGNAPYVGVDRKRCGDLMRAGGQTFADANAEAVALGYCDKLFFLQRVLSRAPAPTAAGYASAVNALGPFATARGVESRFGPGRHDGAAAYYDLVFDGGCSCITYTGPRRTLP
jgi:hypothetical protein